MKATGSYVTAMTLALACSVAWQTPASATEPAQDENLAFAIGVQTSISGFPLMDRYRTLG